MNYLKALGVLRLVSNNSSGDLGIRGYWQDGVFSLKTALSKGALEEFFLKTYIPTPIVVPWSGSDFFDVKLTTVEPQFKETPAGAMIIAAFAATKHHRFAPYRTAIVDSLKGLQTTGIEKKEQMKGEAKARFLALLRGSADPQVADWIDAAAVIEQSKPVFTAMLGSGGGSDGNTHFSDNFMQNIWDVFPEFDSQRITKKGREVEVNTTDICLSLLRNALFGTSTTHLVKKRTSSLFDGGAVGGPNAGHGFERDAMLNPWNFILAVEGALCFAGALCRRAGVRLGSTPAFPFQVHASQNVASSVVEKEQAGKELWLPIWKRPSTAAELLQLFAEGRMQTGNRTASSGVDAARAVAELGVDRGLTGFQRFAILRGRIGGDNYNTAIGLGLHAVRSRTHVDLLREVDQWLSIFRLGSFEKESEDDRKKGNARFTSALRRIERATFDYCRYGGARFFQGILVALGAAEQAVAGAPSFREKAKGLRPLAHLSPEWVAAANDGSREFELALALANLNDATERIGPLRINLEPVALEGSRAAWAEKNRAVVWTAADLSRNLAAVLSRRVMDGLRAGSDSRPLASSHRVSLETITAFIGGELDEARISELIWGLILCNTGEAAPVQPPSLEATNILPLPRAFALLKLLFLDLPAKQSPGSLLPPELFEKLSFLYPDPGILSLLRTGDVPAACQIAARRFRASGLQPRPQARDGARRRDEEWAETACDPAASSRLAAALLLPIARPSAIPLYEMVCRPLQTSNP